MTTPLYPSESEIAVMVMGKRAREWPAKARYLEDKHGLPRVDEFLGGRYWPAVEAFFRARHGMSHVGDTPASRASSRIRIVPAAVDRK